MADIVDELRREAAALGDDDGDLMLRAANCIETLRDSLAEYGDRSKMSPMLRIAVDAQLPAARARREEFEKMLRAAAGIGGKA